MRDSDGSNHWGREMKFEFSLEKLLDHRQSLEDAAKRDYFQAQALVDAAERELKDMYKAIELARTRAAGLESQGGYHAPALSSIDEFIKGQTLRIERHRAKIRELTTEAERLHQILIEAAKERKTLEKLKEHQFEDYKARRKKIELKTADELVVTRFKRASGEP